MKLSYRNKLIIASAAVVLIAVAIIMLLIVPQFSTLSQLDTQVSDADMGVSQAQALLTQRQAIKSRSTETEVTRLRLANQIPENPELPNLIVELQDTVNAAGLVFASIAPNPPTAVGEEPYSAISIAVVVKGTWQDTVDLLQRLRTLTRQVRISSFSVVRFNAGDVLDQDVPNQVETAIGLEVYTMPAEVAAPSPPPDETVE